jgi:glucose-1-phosphate thymidylyltransferase
VQTIEKRQGLKVACLEEIAFRMGYVDRETLARSTDGSSSEYYGYVRAILGETR